MLAVSSVETAAALGLANRTVPRLRTCVWLRLRMPSSSIDRMDSKLSDDLLSESVWAAGEDPEGDITKGPSMNRGAVEKIKRKRLRDMEEEELVDLALVIFDNVREKRKFILVTDLNRFFGDDESMCARNRGIRGRGVERGSICLSGWLGLFQGRAEG